MKLTAGKIWGLRRIADRSGRFSIVAADQRPPIEGLVADRRDGEVPWQDVAAVKRLIVEQFAPMTSAVLVDPYYGFPASHDVVDPSRGLLLTLESSRFDEDAGGRRSSEIDYWSVEKIKRSGADAVKALAWFRPDGPVETIEHQQRFVEGIGEACRRFDIPFVFELLDYPIESDDAAAAERRTDRVVASVEAFNDPRFGIDLFKLESPILPSDVPAPGASGSERVAEAFAWLDEASSRPWVMLSAGARPDEFFNVLHHAYAAGASGYLAGRAIWWEGFQRFPDLPAFRKELSTAGARYVERLNALTEDGALPWFEHRCFGGGGPELDDATSTFRNTYRGFD
jgi:tagatose 1,6-diphosphate aldolase